MTQNIQIKDEHKPILRALSGNLLTARLLIDSFKESEPAEFGAHKEKDLDRAQMRKHLNEVLRHVKQSIRLGHIGNQLHDNLWDTLRELYPETVEGSWTLNSDGWVIEYLGPSDPEEEEEAGKHGIPVVVGGSLRELSGLLQGIPLNNLLDHAVDDEDEDSPMHREWVEDLINRMHKDQTQDK